MVSQVVQVKVAVFAYEPAIHPVFETQLVPYKYKPAVQEKQEPASPSQVEHPAALEHA